MTEVISHDMGMATILEGDVRASMKRIPDKSVHCVVTSPPYYGLRDYGTATWEGGPSDASYPQSTSRSSRSGWRMSPCSPCLKSRPRSPVCWCMPHATKERIYEPEIRVSDPANHRRHRARYEFARQFIPANSVILDCACGSGYGSAILAEGSKCVFAPDGSEEAIAYARENYKGIAFTCSRIEDCHQTGDSFDAVVSLETFEHLAPEVGAAFLSNIARWVKVGGVVVLSSPMLRYKDGKPYVTSPFHVNEMPRAELLALLASTFPADRFVTHFYHQNEGSFQPLLDEHTGFCVMVARRMA